MRGFREGRGRLRDRDGSGIAAAGGGGRTEFTKGDGGSPSPSETVVPPYGVPRPSAHSPVLGGPAQPCPRYVSLWQLLRRQSCPPGAPCSPEQGGDEEKQLSR